MKLFKYIALTIFTSTVALSASAQCQSEHTFCKTGHKKNFKYNGQSRSLALFEGDTVELQVIVHKGMDYRFSFCSGNKEIMDGMKKVEFLIETIETKPVKKAIEKVREVSVVDEAATKKAYEEWKEYAYEGDEFYDTVFKSETEVYYEEKLVFEKTPVVLYNNADDEYALEKAFANPDNTRKFIVKVFVPGEGGGSEKAGGGKLQSLAGPGEFYCVGFLMEHRATMNSSRVSKEY